MHSAFPFAHDGCDTSCCSDQVSCRSSGRVMQLAADAEAEPAAVLDVQQLLRNRLAAAEQLRRALRLPSDRTNVYRLCNRFVCSVIAAGAQSAQWFCLSADADNQAAYGMSRRLHW